MSDYATVQDIIDLKRPLTASEIERAEQLIPVVCNSLRYEAYKVGKDLDQMIEKLSFLADVAKSVTVDVVMRELLTSTTDEPMVQVNQAANGYSVSGTYLVPGGGLFIKDNELKRLGLKRQQVGVIELYENTDSGNTNNTDC